MLRSAAVVLAALALPVSAACADGTVRLGFDPEPGARYRYRVSVDADVVTTIGDRPPRRTSDRSVFTADHAVLRTDAAGSTVEVRLRGEASDEHRFVVRLDRGAQVAEVERIEGVPAQALGDLGLSELFPAAAGAPPARPLRPGDTWSIDEPVELPGAEPARLRGHGRLRELGVVDGREVATVETSYRLPVHRRLDDPEGQLVLEGTQSTRSTSTSTLRHGTVQSVRAVTRGSFRLLLLPPQGVDGPPVPGSLRVTVRSRTERIG